MRVCTCTCFCLCVLRIPAACLCCACVCFHMCVWRDNLWVCVCCVCTSGWSGCCLGYRFRSAFPLLCGRGHFHTAVICATRTAKCPTFPGGPELSHCRGPQTHSSNQRHPFFHQHGPSSISIFAFRPKINWFGTRKVGLQLESKGSRFSLT